MISGKTVTALAADPYTGYFVSANQAGALTFGTLTLVRSTVSKNVAQAINSTSSPTVYSYAASVIGGVRGSTLAIFDSTISGNSTSAIANNPLGVGVEYSHGGGLATFGTDGGITLSNSTVSGNASTRSASALYAYGYANGGGVFGDGQSLVLQNSTIAFNSAELGNGVYQYAAASVNAYGTIIACNDSGAGGTDFDVHEPMILSGANNLFGGSSALLALPGDTLFGDPRLAPLADNGGPTMTHALRDGSPAIDAGNNARGFQFDQRGHHFPRTIGNATDIGAFELRRGH